MAAPITIEVRLDPRDIPAAGAQIARQLQSALDSGLSSIKGAGKRIGDALTDASVEAIRRGEDKIRVIRERAAAQQTVIAAKAAADQQRIQAKALADSERDLRRFAEAQQASFRRAQPPDSLLTFFKRYSSTIREAGESIQQAGQAFLGITNGILNFGRAAVKSAIDIDKQVNVLKSLTGSAAAAEARFKELVAIAAKSPGLTTSLAATLDAQLRVANASVQTIDRLLPVIGKLNAVSPLGDPQKFTQNLVQLISQNFERTDLKELVGQSPLAGELIKQLFNVDSPTNAKAIRASAQKLGITTVDALATGLAEAASTNSKLAGVTESLGTQIEKLRDRVIVAFRPLGLSIIQALQPLVEKAVPIIERLSKAFADLPDSTKQLIIVFAGIAAAIGPFIFALGGLIQAFGAFGNIITVVSGALGLSGVGGAAGIGGLLAGLGPILLPLTAAVIAFGAAWLTNFGDIRQITAEVFEFVKIESVNAASSIKSISPNLEELKTEFRKLSDDAKPLFRALWESFRGEAKLGIEAVKVITTQGFTLLLDLKFLAETVGNALGKSLSAGLLAAVTAGLSNLRGLLGPEALTTILTGGTSSLFRGIDRLFKPQRDAAARRAAINADAARSLQIEAELEGRVGAANNFIGPDVPAGLLNPPPRRPPGLGGGGSAKASVDNAKQLSDALRAQQKAAGEDALRLLKDQNDREISELKRSYDEKTIAASDYYPKVEALTRSTFNAEIELIRQQIGANAEQFLKAKEGSVEKIRLSQEFDHLLAELTLKTRALTDAETDNARKFAESAKQKVIDSLKITQSLALPAQENLLNPNVNPIQAAGEKKARQVEEARRAAHSADLALQIQEIAIQNQIATGALSEAEGKERTLALQRQYRDQLIASLELQKATFALDADAVARINIEIEKLRTLGQSLSPTDAFFKGLRSNAETTAEAFERIGTNLKDKFLGVLDSGIDKLTKKFGFFKDLIGDILKSLTRKVLSQLFGLGTPGAGGGGGGGGGGILGNILGGLFGPGANTGGGGLFATGGFAGGSGAAGILGAFIPPSISGALPKFAANSPAAKPLLDQIFGGGGTSGGGGILSKLLGGLTGGGAVSLLPALLGAGIGTSFGGQSGLGQVLGGIGGAAVGLGLSFGASVFGAGGGLAAAGLAALGPAALIGAPLIVAAILLGRAKQRRKDEAATGDFLTDAITNLRQLVTEIKTDQITGDEARRVFESEVMATFIAQVNTIKTKSVRESRLLNQTRDLRALFEKEAGPEIEAQKLRIKTGAFGGRTIRPEFANSGIVPGTYLGYDNVNVLAHPGEMFLNRGHQEDIARLLGADIFQRIGVPGAGMQPVPTAAPQAFPFGGIVQPSVARNSGDDQPIEITVVINNNMTEEEAVAVVQKSQTSAAGRQIFVRTIKQERGFGSFR